MSKPTLIPLAARLGARVEGLGLSGSIAADQVRWILDRLADRKVLVFPRQALDARAFHAFACRFGTLQHHVLRKYRHRDYPGLSWLTNVGEDGAVDQFGVTRATTWHSDGSYTQEPPALGILYALEVPSKGGGTLFADMCHAYDQLDAPTRRKVSELTGLHRHGAGPGGDMYDDALDDDQEEGFKDAVHPVVATHPRSGRKLLYLNSTHTRKFAELDSVQSVALLEDLVGRATAPGKVYEHHWQVGDLLIWDQCATIHRGAGDYAPEERRVKLRAIVQELH